MRSQVTENTHSSNITFTIKIASTRECEHTFVTDTPPPVPFMSTEDTLNFWKGIADVGLLGEVVTNINTELLQLLNGVQQRTEPAALQDTGTKLHWTNCCSNQYC